MNNSDNPSSARITIVAVVTSAQKENFLRVKAKINEKLPLGQGALAALAIRKFVEIYGDNPLKLLEDLSVSDMLLENFESTSD